MRRSPRRTRAAPGSILILFVILAASAPARPARADVPWAQGVPEEVQAKANALFAEGNQLFAQQAHAPALKKYKQAIALWDHPLIRFNMAVTEIRLDRILDAAEDLEKALRYGDQPFSPELYQQAQDYERLVAGRVGYVEASCDQQQAHVLLDGKPWFDCPGTRKLRVLAGEHVIVGERKGYMTMSRRLVVAGGDVAKAKLTLLPIDVVMVLDYPVARWIPWTFAGTGVAAALGGVVVYIVGNNEMDSFQSDFASVCPSGCRADLSDQPALAREYDRARLKGKLAFSLIASGGAIAVIGTIWGSVLNRPSRHLPGVEVLPASGGAIARVGWPF